MTLRRLWHRLVRSIPLNREPPVKILLDYMQLLDDEISGRLVDSQYISIARATVNLYSPDRTNGSLRDTTVTDQNGQWDLKSIGDGPYHIEFINGSQTAWLNIAVPNLAIFTAEKSGNAKGVVLDTIEQRDA